jgi:hypothetical protein
METMAKKFPMNNKGFKIAVVRRLFRGSSPFIVPILITFGRKNPKTIKP